MKKYEILLKNKVGNLKKKIPQLISENFLKDRVNLTSISISGFFLVVVWIYSFFKFRVTDFLIPIRYNSFLGVTELGNWYEIYKIPLFITFCFILNVILADLIFKKDRMVSYVLVGANVFIALIGAVLVLNFGRLLGNL